MEWVEVKGPSVEVAVEAALAELGIESREDADIEILQEPEKGFLGIGRTDAVVRVKPPTQEAASHQSLKGKTRQRPPGQQAAIRPIRSGSPNK